MLKNIKKHYRQHVKNDQTPVFQDTTGRLLQIILIRHGEPDLDKTGWRNRDQAIQFMKDYDSVGVILFSGPPVVPESLSTATIFHSSVPRAKNTAEIAFNENFELCSDDRFREFERKCMWFFNIKMPLKFWTTGSRLLWFMGLNDKDIENKKKAKARADENAGFLIQKAEEKKQVVLVAHGLHNKYTKKYLRKSGWKKVFSNGHGYLSVIIMARSEK